MRKIKKPKRVLKQNSYIMLLICLFSFIFLSLSSPEPQNFSSNQQLNEEQSSSNEISNWEARLELARVLSYLKKYDESLQEYQTLLQADPNSFIARIEMAKILFYEGKTEEALTELSKVPPQKIDDSTWVMIADIYRKKKNYPEAEHIYAQYLKKLPQDDKVRLKLAELLSWEKRYEESIHQYRIILSHRPQDIQIRRRYAQLLTWMGDDEEAVKEWKKTL